LPDPFSDVGGREFIWRVRGRAENDEGLVLAIEERVTGRAVGSTSLMLRRVRIADLGYWLVRDARGRGIGGETVGLLVPWALEELALDAVEAFVEEDNAPSRRILAACGFSLLGTRRHAVGRIDEEFLVYRRDR
jgi:RimJ/RimL family protein N-acetyltransferase